MIFVRLEKLTSPSPNFSGVQAHAHGQLVGAQGQVHRRAAQRDDRAPRVAQLLRLNDSKTAPRFKFPAKNYSWRQNLKWRRYQT